MGKGKMRDVKEKEKEKCLKWTQHTKTLQKKHRIKEDVMMVWYESTMNGVSIVNERLMAV